MKTLSYVSIMTVVMLSAACSKRSEVLPISQEKSIQLNAGSTLSVNSSSHLQLRGENKPLVIVNGREMEESEFKNISPNDIESMEVHKNANTDLFREQYGNRADNGVIVIRLKSGATLEKSAASESSSGSFNGIRIENHSTEKTSSSGKLSEIRIIGRGQSSENPPLTLVNGKEATPEVMNALDKNRVKSVNVLKGEPALKQYGEKGKNGVILIELKP